MPRIKIEKLIFGGQGFARIGGKACFIWGVVPGDEVEVEIKKEKKNFVEAELKEVISPSQIRIEPKEDHYLACSPWQIIDWSEENKWKEIIAEEVFSRTGKIELNPNIYFTNQEFNYRNKMTFRVFSKKDGSRSLAFYGRESHSFCPAIKCELATKEINNQMTDIVSWLNDKNEEVDNVLIRSNSQGQVMAGAFLGRKQIKHWGEEFLQEKIFNVGLTYGLGSFFQVNVPVFTEVLFDIKKYLNKDDEIIDYYSGVGAISLPLFTKFKSAVLVEDNKEAVKFAKINILNNKIKNCLAVKGTIAGNLDYITENKVVILDPPRAGLEKKVLRKLINTKPRKIIYLSCDLATQARDLANLKDFYKISFSQLYNFFPRTPHIESLLVLEKK